MMLWECLVVGDCDGDMCTLESYLDEESEINLKVRWRQSRMLNEFSRI